MREVRPRETPGRHATSTAEKAVLAVSSLLLLARALLLSNRYLVLDDAYISFRYAKNLADGHGLVYNVGERVEGFTNFLWTMILAAGSWLGLDLARLSQVLGTLASLGVLWLLYRRARAHFPDAGTTPASSGLWLAALPPVVWAAMASQARLATSGMETMAFTLFVLLGYVLAFETPRLGLAGLAFALAALTRPEGVMYWGLALGLLGLVALVSGLRQRRWASLLAPLRMAATFLAVFVPYFLLRWLYYGWLLPNTFYAKVGDVTSSRFERGWELLVRLVGEWGIWPLLVLALLSLAGRGRRAAALPLWAFTLVSPLYFVAVGGDLLDFFGPRFLIPSLPMLLLLAAYGVEALLRPLPAPKWRRAAAAVALVAVTAWALVFTWPKHFDRLEHFSAEMEGWHKLGEWMNEHTPPDSSFATGAAGITPYITGQYTIDMYGLTDLAIGHMPPRTTGFIRVAHEKFAPHYVLERHPTYVLSYLTPDGRLATGGMARVEGLLYRCYRWRLLVRVANAPRFGGVWVRPADGFSPELYEQGFRAALFERAPNPACPL